jgi:hypothetical protein
MRIFAKMPGLQVPTESVVKRVLAGEHQGQKKAAAPKTSQPPANASKAA